MKIDRQLHNGRAEWPVLRARALRAEAVRRRIAFDRDPAVELSHHVAPVVVTVPEAGATTLTPRGADAVALADLVLDLFLRLLGSGLGLVGVALCLELLGFSLSLLLLCICLSFDAIKLGVGLDVLGLVVCWNGSYVRGVDIYQGDGRCRSY